jgi:Cyclin M transmembrane N-terminal domain
MRYEHLSLSSQQRRAVGAPAISWDAPGIIFLKLLAVVFLVLLNGFFVASEFAIVKVRSSQLDALAARGNGHARLARHVTSHLDAYLSARQLGITLSSLGLGWLGEPFLARMIEPFFALANITSPALIETIAFALAFAAITILHIVLGELAPKSLAIRKPVPTTLWISPPPRIFYVVFKPAIWLLNELASWLLRRIFHLDPFAEGELAHSEEELRLILDESAKAARICPVSQQIVANAFEIRRRVVREVMTPRGEVVYLDTGLSFRENLQRAKAARTLESSPPMPAPNKVRRMNSRRDVPASISPDSLWTDPASMDGAQVQSQLRSLQDLTRWQAEAVRGDFRFPTEWKRHVWKPDSLK